MSDERGYAAMEAFLVGLVLMVPLIWVSIAASSLHRTALASSSAVREAGIVASRAANAASAQREVGGAIARALLERGVNADGSRFFLSWAAGRSGPVHVELEVPVPILAVPFVGRPVGPAIWVKARHVAHREPYRSVGE